MPGPLRSHRFDPFARRIAAGMLETLRVMVSLFATSAKDTWSPQALHAYLKKAESRARHMLREIAGKLHVFPKTVRIRTCTIAPTDGPSARATCFRLGVRLPSPTREAQAGNTAHAPVTNASQTASPYAQRLQALEDVIAHPGKHAARMARALFRAEHTVQGERLTLASVPDLIHFHIQGMMEAHLRKDGLMFHLHNCEARRLDSS